MRTGAAALALMLAACGDGGSGDPAQAVAAEPVATGGCIRLPAVPGQLAAGYLTLRGGRTARTLVVIASPRAARIELHRSMAGASGMMHMQPVPRLPVPAGERLVLAPGGLHLMSFGLAARPGDRVPLSLRFAEGGTLAVTAQAIAAGDPLPCA